MTTDPGDGPGGRMDIPSRENPHQARQARARWVYLDACRVIAIFLMVLLHVLAAQWWQDPVGSVEWHINTLYFSLSRICVPLFFMMSGILLLAPRPGKEFHIGAFYKKNVLRLVTALLFWSACYYAIVVYAFDPGKKLDDAGLFITQVIGGHPHQHWFLFTLIGLYVAVPLFRCIAASKTACGYFIVLWVVYELIVTKLYLVVILFPGIDPAAMGWMGTIFEFVGKTTPPVAIGASGYMFIGHYLHQYPPSPKTRAALQSLGVFAFLFTIYATGVASAREGEASEAFFAINSFNMCAMTVAAMLTIRSVFTDRMETRKTVLLFVSECAFGIYLVHDIFLVFLRNHGFTAGLFTRVLSGPAFALAVCAMSLCVVAVIRKIPVLRNYIV